MSVRPVIIAFFLLTLTGSFRKPRAELDSAKIQFIDTLTLRLQQDYRLCTGDSSQIDVQDLLTWRKSVDSILSRDDYGTIANNFFRETGLSPANVRPCEIVQWLQNVAQRMQEYSDLLNTSRDSLHRKRNDSLYLAKQLAGKKRAPYHLFNMPFGIQRRAFKILMSTRNAGTRTETAQFIRYDSLAFGPYIFRVAFHFTKDDRYSAWEIESNSCHFDSLNTRIRPLLNSMAAYFENIAGTPPDHIYRVGQFDIVPGRLAICRLWTFPQVTAYFGLARKGTRFYAKAIVRRRE